MLQRIRNIVTFVGRSGYKVSERSWKFLKKDVTTYQKDLGRLMQVDVKTGQEHLGSYCKTMLQRVRNILEVNILTLTG